MKPFYSRYVASLGALLLLALSLVGCRDTLLDRTQPDPTSPEQIGDGGSDRLDGAVTVSLTYDTPALRTPTTRAALTVDQESEFKPATTRVMIFKSTGEYLRDAKVTKITPSNGDHQQGEITFLALPGEGLTFVVLANLSEEDKVKKVSGTKAEVLKNFEYTVTADTDFAKTGLPMWGELAQQTIDPDVSAVQTIGTIHLLRAVARVDVGLNMTAKDTNGNDGDFDEKSQTLTSDIVDPKTKKSIKVQWSLLEVKLYNAAKNGRIAPDAGNYALDGGKPKATKVTRPTTPTKHEEALTYTAKNDLLMRTIYVPETINPEPTSASAGASTTPGDKEVYLSRPYLILKLSYEQTDGTASGETYFRVDFLEKNGKEATAKYTYLSLLRNFRYKVNVMNIGGLGFDSEDEAKKGPAANIMYNVVVWDESTLSNVVYDGQYMLGVQNDKLLFHKNGGTFSTKVQTSWPGGFKVEGLPDWVKVKSIEPSDPSATGDTDEKIVTFEVTKSTTEQRDFSGAYIQAGRMQWKLDITQLNTLDLRIEIFSDRECTQELQYIELDERGKETPDNDYTVGKMKFYVRVTPAARISAVNDETRAPFTFTGADATSPSRPPIETAKEVSTGVYEFEVTADRLSNPKNPFETRQNKYHFITEQSGEKAEATLAISQTEYNIVFYEDEELTNPMLGKGDAATYFMNGTDKQFYVRSNIPYIIWMDNQMIDESARSDENANADGSSKFAIVTGYYDKDGKFVKLDYDSSNTMNNWRSVKTEDAPTPNGSPLKFRAAEADDALKIIYGHVMWVACTTMKSLEWKFPLYNKQLANQDKVTMIQTNFVAGYFLPEANSYPITLGETGLLIPIERRINHAARYYEENFDTPFGWVDDNYQHKNDKTAKIDPFENWESYKQRNQLNRLDDDDNISLEVLWTDIQSVTEKGSEPARNPIKQDGTAPLKLLVPVEIKGERYAYVLPGDDGADNYGNLVFCVRDKDKKRVDNHRASLLDPAEQGKDVILWSFHLILYRPGEIPLDKGDQSAIDRKTITYLHRDSAKEPQNYGTDWSYDVKVWPYALGAFDIPQEWKNTAGFVQNNRNLRDLNYRRVGMHYQFGRKDPFPRYINAIGRPTRFVGHNGRTVDFKFLKSTTISLRESIEYPMVLVGNAGGHQWLTEGGKTLNTNIALGGTSSFGAYGLWGGGSPVGNESSCSQRTDIMRVLTKTVFDPCPYGFRIPIPGYSSTRMFWGDNRVNADRMRMNNAVFMMDGTATRIYNTFNGTMETLFGVWSGNSTSGTGQVPFAVATSYIAQAHYPVFMFTFGTGAPEERYQADIHRSSPVVVRPFNNVQESDWEKYISR